MAKSYNSDLDRVAAFYAKCDRRIKTIAAKHGMTYEEALEEVEDRKLGY